MGTAGSTLKRPAGDVHLCVPRLSRRTRSQRNLPCSTVLFAAFNHVFNFSWYTHRCVAKVGKEWIGPSHFSRGRSWVRLMQMIRSVQRRKGAEVGKTWTWSFSLSYITLHFCVAAPFVWNSLPRHLRNDDISREQFARDLKTVVFARAYSSEAPLRTSV